MPGYSTPCRYCGELVPPDANVCPFCAGVSPIGPLRCPKCRAPIEFNQKVCSNCGLALMITCPSCARVTFFGPQCQYCRAPTPTVCPWCGTVQPPGWDNKKCSSCKRPFMGGKGGKKL